MDLVDEEDGLVLLEELVDDPHRAASGGLADITHADGRAAHVPKLPLEMDGRRFGARLDVPRVGGHTAALLAELGYAEDAVRDLVAAGVVGT